MRHLTVLLTTLLLALGTFARPVSANGDVSPEKLEKAGWTCISPDPRAVHCIKDIEAVFAGEARSATLMSFDAETGEFWGTELALHQDLYNGQPCPLDEVHGGDGSYVNVSDRGLAYFVCHHFESPLT